MKTAYVLERHLYAQELNKLHLRDIHTYRSVKAWYAPGERDIEAAIAKCESGELTNVQS